MKEGQETYRLLQQKGQGGMEILYVRYGRKLLGYGMHSWKLDEDESWELVYKTLYRLLEVHQDYRFASEEKFASFVFTTYVNYLRNYWRDNRRNRELQYEPLEDHAYRLGSDENEPVPQSLPARLLQEELDKLEDWQRILLLLRSQDLPYARIVPFAGRPEEQLKVYYQRLKKQLLERINSRLNQIKAENHGKAV
ncbi:MAG: RNA polymerase, sigma-24 subunit, ECF subfamily [Bacteroidetes bacterium]|nr:MAG: RNA polymerase, sigma-24 subunit, ECF subfamily [Bacteroidota bacterium]